MALGVPNIATAGVAIRPDVSGFQRQLSRGISGPLREVTGIVGTGLAAAVGSAIGAGQAFGGFETSLQQIVGLVGVAQEEVDAMGESIKNLGPEVGAGPEELADALFFVTSAGLRGSDAMDTVEQSARAAAAGLGDITDVADAATSAMNAYGTDTLSASDATDILVATVREGKVEADSLAASIGRVVPIASELGVSFNEVGAAIAATTRTGLDANEAVTALRALLNQINQPGQAARDTLESVGLSAQGLRTQLREEGLLSVLQTLGTEFEGNADALGTIIPNVRALTGFLSLMGSNSEQVVGVFERMEDVSGATDDAFDAVADTTEFRLNQEFARLRTALVDIGAEAAPAMVDALTAAAEVAVQVLPDVVRVGTTILEAVAGVDDLFLRIRGGAAQFTAFGQNLLGIFSQPARDAGQLASQVGDLTTTLLAGGDPATAFANSLVQLQDRLESVGSNTGVTNIGFERLNEVARLSEEQLRQVASQMITSVRAGEDIGFTIADIARLFGDLEVEGGRVGNTFLTIDERARLMEAGVITAEQALLGVPPPLDEISQFGGAAATAIDDVGTAADDADFETAEEEASGLALAFQEAAENGESLRGVIQALTDPVFAAVDSFLDYKDLLEEVDEDGERTAKEQLELGRALIGVGVDFDNAGQNIDEALQAIAIASDQSVGEVRDDLAELGIEVRDNEIGSALTDGILEDLDGLAAFLGGRLTSEVQGGIDIAKSNLRIESPSRVAAEQIGQPIAEGVAAGIRDGAGAIGAALSASIDIGGPPTTTGQAPTSRTIVVNNPTVTDLERSTERALAVERTSDLLLGIE